MLARIFVTSVAEPSESDEYIFQQPVVTIGRDSSSDLTLPDKKRVVSKQHAELSVNSDGCRLTDLGSKNFTYLNGERLNSSKTYPLENGDIFRIGDFECQFFVVEEKERPADHDRTVFDPGFVNPFAEPLSDLAAKLSEIRSIYARESGRRRQEALEDALTEVMDPGEIGATREFVAELFGFSTDNQAAGTPLPHPPAPQPSVRADKPPLPQPAPTPAARRPDPGFSLPVRTEQVVDALLEAIMKVVTVPPRFRHEFIGQTIIQSGEASVIYDGDAEALKAHLFDPSVSGEQAGQRLQLVTEAVEDVVIHQVAMLDGYKAAAQAGSGRMIEELDPLLLQKQILKQGGIARYLPILAKSQVFDELMKRCEVARLEDWSASERRVFRPAFIKAYLGRVTGMKQQRTER